MKDSAFIWFIYLFLKAKKWNLYLKEYSANITDITHWPNRNTGVPKAHPPMKTKHWVIILFCQWEQKTGNRAEFVFFAQNLKTKKWPKKWLKRTLVIWVTCVYVYTTVDKLVEHNIQTKPAYDHCPIAPLVVKTSTGFVEVFASEIFFILVLYRLSSVWTQFLTHDGSVWILICDGNFNILKVIYLLVKGAICKNYVRI